MDPDEGLHPNGSSRVALWPDAARVGFVALAAMTLWVRPAWLLEPTRIAGWVSLGLGGYPIYREALQNLRERRMTMELSMMLAIICAAAIGEFVTALVITLFVLVAEILEGLTVGRGRRAIHDLLDVLPPTATVRRGDITSTLPLGELRPGDLILVNPGGRLPVDGTVLRGHSYIDESAITGEPTPVGKEPGSWVHAGSMNQSGALDIRVERLGKDTAFGQIVEAVEAAERSRAPLQKLADRLAGYLVYFALGCAALTWLLTRDLRSTISVVIVAGACGIAAGTPLAILGAIGRAAHLGAIIKGGIYLEALSRVDTLVFDKTGTLTLGRPVVVALAPEAGHSEAELLTAAAMAEGRSEHPIAQAILRCAQSRTIQPPDPDRFQSVPGRGVFALGSLGQVVAGSRSFLLEHGIEASPSGPPDQPGATEVLVALDGNWLGTIWIADTPRAEARAAMAALRAMGIRVILLSGDNPGSARSIATLLGIAEAEGALLPKDKQTRIADLKRSGARVAMVGDGVNDAPAMVEAEVGISMGSGADVAREAADVVLIGNDLTKLVDTLRVARQMRRVVLQNFTGTLVVDGIGLGLAAFGLLNPMLAAFIHVTSELVFIVNSTRMLPSRSNA